MKLDKEMIDRIGDDVARKAIELENIPLDTIVYDTTNYYNDLDVLTISELSKINQGFACPVFHIKRAGGITACSQLPNPP